MDTKLQRLMSNNPAVTAPASSVSFTRDNVVGKRRVVNNDQRQYVLETSPTVTDQSSGSKDGQELSFPTRYERGWRRIVRNFSPSWFSTSMGTGIVSILFIAIPFQHQATYYLSVIFFCLNLVIFSLAAIASFLRYTLYPEIWTVMIKDPTNSLFLGTAPMGFATLIESLVFTCLPHWGPWATYFAFALWIVDAIVALTVTLSLSFILMSQSNLRSLDRITAAQLLPISATVVASGTGAETAHALLLLDPTTPNSYPVRLALGTYVVSLVMWGMAVPLSLITLVIYYQRLTIHKLPPRETVVSVFLPLGPLGMGGYTIMYIGDLTRSLLPLVPPLLSHIPSAADIIYTVTLLIGLLMWSFGVTWFVYALAAIVSTHAFPFNMGWWGFTFPLGVFAVSTIQIGVELPSFFFRVLGTVFAGCVVALWGVVAAGTVKGAWSGELFYSPCLRDMKPKPGMRGARVRNRSRTERKGKDDEVDFGEDGDDVDDGVDNDGEDVERQVAENQRQEEKDLERRKMNNVDEDPDEDEQSNESGISSADRGGIHRIEEHSHSSREEKRRGDENV